MPFFGVPIRNGLPIGLGSVAGFGVQQFDPSQLFEGGTVAGAWYDPSDLSTMFTTSAGTTPVAMPGQGSAVSVGLMLDKSQGLVLGPEVVVSPLAGTLGASYSIVGDAIVRNGSTGTAVLSPVGGVIPSTSKTYLVTFTASGVTGDSVAVRVGGGATAYGPFAGNGTFTLRVPGGGTTGAITFLPYAGGAATATYSNISVRELPGNHAIAFNDTTARPELRARVNRLERTEEISNAYWTKTQLASFAASGVTPNGVTAFNLVPNTNVDSHRLSRSAINIAGPKTMRVVAKANGYNFLSITDLTTFSAGIDLITGTQWGGAGTAVITSLGNGWWEIKVSGTATASTSFAVEPLSSASFLAYAGDGVSGVLVGEFDDRFTNIGANVPAYQRIADANTYDTSGFPLYLSFDGIDDSMYTPANLNLSGTDKVAVFAGVRKLSDAAQGVVAELSATIASNNGTFLLAAPDGATQTYGWDSKGTTQVDAVASSLAAPRTNVLVGTADIAGDSCIIRVNGAVADTEAGDQGTGNYGTYPLFIGARNNTSLWFNGHLYSLAVVGSAVSAGNIAAMESWVAGRTGIQI